jgi:hypothetical protein
VPDSAPMLFIFGAVALANLVMVIFLLKNIRETPHLAN